MELLDAAHQHPVVAIVAVGLLAYALLASTVARQKYPNGVPWIGKQGNGPFALTKATFASMTRSNTWLAEGYEKVRPA